MFGVVRVVPAGADDRHVFKMLGSWVVPLILVQRSMETVACDLPESCKCDPHPRQSDVGRGSG